MDKNITLGVVVKWLDGLSGPAAKAMSGLTAETAKAARAQRTEYQRLAQAREALGVRPERTIQREIQRTQAAYRRLAESGTLSWREQARAANAMHRQVTQLNNEMGKLSKLQKALAIGAGVAAAGYVLKPKAEQAMAYDIRLAQMANTAFTSRDTAGRIAGKRELNAMVIEAIRSGGGTRESAADALDSIIASWQNVGPNAVPFKEVLAMLPTLTKAATASGADPTLLGQIGMRGMQTMGLKPSQVGRVMDMAITAGQEGGFELKDMAKWLPQQMAAAKMSGMSGIPGLAKLLAANQASAITAGSKDEAGNNLVNLLAKINSRDTAMDAKRLGINLPKYLAQQRANGVDSLDAFVGLVDQTVSKQTAWKQLQKKLAAAKDDAGKRETLESMAAIVQGSGIGRLVQDRQALMALVGIIGNRGYMSAVEKKVLEGGGGATDKNFAVISDTASFQTQRVGNEKQNAEQTAMESLMPSIKSISGGMADMAQKYPGLTTATVAATTALTALAAAAGAAAGANVLTGGGMGGGLKTAAAVTGGFLLKRALPVVGAASVGYTAGSYINDGLSWGLTKATGRDTSLGSWIYDLTHSDKQKLSGEIRVKVDQDGRVSSVRATSSNANLPMRVDAGMTMVAP